MAPGRTASSKKRYFDEDDDDKIVQKVEVKVEKVLPKPMTLSKEKIVVVKHPMSSFHLWLQEEKNRSKVEDYKLRRSNFQEKAAIYWRNQVDEEEKEEYSQKYKTMKTMWEKQNGK